MKKRMPKVLATLLALVLFSAGCQQEVVVEAPGASSHDIALEKRPEEKMYWNGTIEEDFDGSSVIVIMDKNKGGINKKHEANYFGRFEKKYIKDLTTIIGDIKNTLFNEEKFRQILEIKLPKDSKENVVNVIRELEKPRL